jgi:hypothetical protein
MDHRSKGTVSHACGVPSHHWTMEDEVPKNGRRWNGRKEDLKRNLKQEKNVTVGSGRKKNSRVDVGAGVWRTYFDACQ